MNQLKEKAPTIYRYFKEMAKDYLCECKCGRPDAQTLLLQISRKDLEKARFLEPKFKELSKFRFKGYAGNCSLITHFCMGEDGDQQAIIKKHGKHAKDVWKFVYRIYDQFPKYEDACERKENNNASRR